MKSEIGGRPALTVLAVQPDAECGPSRIVDWAAAQGVVLDVRDPAVPGQLPESCAGYDALLVLGGDMGVGDTAEFPWLIDVMDRMREAADEQLPTLGVCLGAQLLAVALGGTVERGAQGLETGVVEVHQLAAAAEDQLLDGVPASFFSGAMHRDAVTALPDGAKLLAVGDLYPHQVFRHGQSWGVQFHPEISPDDYLAWGPAIWGPKPEFREEYDRTVREFVELDDQIEPACERLVSNFFEIVVLDAAQRSVGSAP